MGGLGREKRVGGYDDERERENEAIFVCWTAASRSKRRKKTKSAFLIFIYSAVSTIEKKRAEKTASEFRRREKVRRSFRIGLGRRVIESEGTNEG